MHAARQHALPLRPCLLHDAHCGELSTGAGGRLSRKICNGEAAGAANQKPQRFCRHAQWARLQRRSNCWQRRGDLLEDAQSICKLSIRPPLATIPFHLQARLGGACWIRLTSRVAGEDLMANFHCSFLAPAPYSPNLFYPPSRRALLAAAVGVRKCGKNSRTCEIGRHFRSIAAKSCRGICTLIASVWH